MGMTDSLRLSSRLATALALASTLVLTGAVRANELGSGAHVSGIVIHDAAETLRDYCSWSGATLVFTVPGGDSWELVTSTSDPAITNPGDGSFHVFDSAEVRAAIAGVRFPLQRVSADVFILPFPRRDGLESAAGPGLILLSPGVRTLPVSQQHAEFTHELGHVVQYALMPDEDAASWATYRQMRGIVDPGTFSAVGPHGSRPHEIFAEDFRALFGDAQATVAGTIENSALAYPTSVSGLAAFVQGLANAPVVVTPITVSSVAHGTARFSRGGAGAAVLDLFDVGGRRVASLAPMVNTSGCAWSWDGHGAAGARVGAAVVFARARDGIGGTAKLVRLP
jgi:hypothetical protein